MVLIEFVEPAPGDRARFMRTFGLKDAASKREYEIVMQMQWFLLIAWYRMHVDIDQYVPAADVRRRLSLPNFTLSHGFDRRVVRLAMTAGQQPSIEPTMMDEQYTIAIRPEHAPSTRYMTGRVNIRENGS